MSKLILALHSGPHDSVAALFDDYDLKAAVQLERLTRVKGDGGKHPDACIDEVLAIAGATRADVDVISMSRTLLDTKFFRRLRGLRWLEEAVVRRGRGKTLQYMTHEMRRCRSKDYDDLFDLAAYRRDGGFRPEQAPLSTITMKRTRCRHCSTADGMTPSGYCRRRRRYGQLQPSHFAAGVIKTIYGGEDLR